MRILTCRLCALVALLVLPAWRSAPADDPPPAGREGAAAAPDAFDAFEGEFGGDSAAVRSTQGRDPLQPLNRLMFTVNDKLYFLVFKPITRTYGRIVPEVARLAVRRCERNLAFPARFVNNTLQGRFKGAGTELGRFVVNSTVGLLGLFDPADSYVGLLPCEEDFGLTLGRYGLGEGCPLVLPVLGQTNLRDALGRIPDAFLNPISYIDPTRLAVAVHVFKEANYTSLHLGEYEALKSGALDPYTFFRDAYRQTRNTRIEKE